MHAPQMTTSASMPPNVPQTSVEHRHVEGWAQSVFYIYRDYPGILIVLISFWSGMG